MAHMHPFHMDDQQDSGIPWFGKNGTALTAEERAAIAKRRGQCVKCGSKTHESGIMRRPLTNEDIYKGTCIKCNPDKVPSHILADYHRRNPPPVQTAPVSTARGSRLRVATHAVMAANHHAQAQQTRVRPSVNPPSMMSAEVTPIQQQVPVGAQVSRMVSHRPGSSTTIENPLHSSGRFASGTLPNFNASTSNIGPLTSSGRNTSEGMALPKQSSQGISRSGPIDAEDFKSNNEEDCWDIVSALKNNRDNPDVLRRKLHALRNLAEDQAGALYEIKDIMELHRNNSRLLMVASGAVWGITSSSEDKKLEAGDTGVLDAVMDAARSAKASNDLETVQWSLGALAGLAVAPGNKQFLAERGGIELIVETLQAHCNSPGVFEWACRALHVMVSYDGDTLSPPVEKNIVTIEEAKGVSVVISAMKKHISESTAQWWALKLLWRLQDRSDSSAADRTLKKMLDDEGVSVCVKILKARSTSTEVFQQASELLCTLLSVAPSSAYATASECVSTGVRTMGEHQNDLEMQEVCCHLLSTLARGGSQCRREIATAGAAGKIVKTMIAHPSSLILIESGMTLLWILSSDTSLFDYSMLGDAKQIIESCRQNHPDDTNLNIAICGLVSNLIIASQTTSSDIPVETIVSLSTDADSAVSTQASRALSSIFSRFPDAGDRAVDDSVCDRYMEGLLNPSPDVQASCCGALTSIALQSEDKRNKIFSSGGLDTASAALLVANSEALAEGLLELVSALVTSEKKKALQVPNQTIQSILAAMRSFPGTSEVACTTIRNTMLVLVPGFAAVNVDGLAEALTNIVDSLSSSVDLVIEACNAIWAFAAKQPDITTSALSHLFRSVLGLMTRHRGDGAPFHSAILTTASGALACVMQRIRENPVNIPDNDIDMIISILDLVIECDVENKELMERILDVILSLSHLAKETLIQFGVIVVVIDCMVEHEAHEMIQQKGCAILAMLASTENLQVNLSIAETDGIDMIVNALAVFGENKEIYLDACKALSHLSIDHESRMLISSQGGLILLVNAMNTFRDDVDLLEAACSALLNLSSDAEEQVLAGSNVVETVVNIMRHQPDSPKLQEKGLGVLQNVSMRSRDAKRAIAQAGGVDAVTFAIKEFMGSPSVLERAFTTMWSMAVLEENQVRIADAGGINLVVNGMMANITYEKVQKQACGCLCTLSSNSRNKTLIRDAGGVDSIVYSMWAHYNSENLQIEACRALSSLAVNVQTNEVMIATDGEISAIMSAMRRFPNSERLQEHACVALRNFMLSADNANLVRNSREEVERLMDHAASRFPERCSDRAKQVLASLR